MRWTLQPRGLTHSLLYLSVVLHVFIPSPCLCIFAVAVAVSFFGFDLNCFCSCHSVTWTLISCQSFLLLLQQKFKSKWFYIDMDNKNEINSSPRKYLFQSLTYSLVRFIAHSFVHSLVQCAACACVLFIQNQIEEHDCRFIALLLSTNDETICGRRINLKNIIHAKSTALAS